MQGHLRKMLTSLASPVQYQLPLSDQQVDLNPLIGKSIDDAGIMESEGFTLICFHRGVERLEVTPETILVAGDTIGFSTDITGAKTLWATIGLKPLYSTKEQKADRHRHHLVEVVISRRNSMIGQQIGQVESEDRNFEVWLVGFARGDDPLFRRYKKVIGKFHYTPLEWMKLGLGEKSPRNLRARDLRDLQIQ